MSSCFKCKHLRDISDFEGGHDTGTSSWYCKGPLAQMTSFWEWGDRYLMEDEDIGCHNFEEENYE